AGRLLGDARILPDFLVVDHGAAAGEAGDAIEFAVDRGRVHQAVQPGVALLQVLLVWGDVHQGAVGGVGRHLGVAHVDDIRWVLGGKCGGHLGGDAIPLLELGVDLGAGLGGELLVDGLHGLGGVIAVHVPDGQGARTVVATTG